MPVFKLIDEPLFPPLSYADPNGLLAVGGDLSTERLLLAYSSGIFPWFNEHDPILWWSPDPRYIIEPAKVRISSSLGKTIRRGKFDVSIDRAFYDVIEACSADRKKGGGGTWITKGMKEAYGRLFELGFAHSVESWLDGELAGGLYGVCLGRCFFGESMFYRVRDASKVAFVAIARELARLDFEMIDCQLPSEHLKSLGARGVRREEFVQMLERGGVEPSTAGLQKGCFPVSITG